MYEHRCPENIKKLYKSSGKGDNQEQYKAICEAYMVSTSEGFTGNILISPGPYLSGKQPCAKKHCVNFMKFWMSTRKLLYAG